MLILLAVAEDSNEWSYAWHVFMSDQSYGYTTVTINSHNFIRQAQPIKLFMRHFFSPISD